MVSFQMIVSCHMFRASGGIMPPDAATSTTAWVNYRHGLVTREIKAVLPILRHARVFF